MDLSPHLTEARHQVDVLLDAITAAAKRAGICRDDVERLDGPTAIMFCGDIAGEIIRVRAATDPLLVEVMDSLPEANRIAGGSDADPMAWADEIAEEASNAVEYVDVPGQDLVAYRASLVTIAGLCVGALRAHDRVAEPPTMEPK